jgi:hypothetical protein
MDSEGLEFRATRDLDVVLHVEALTPAFAEAFWQFVADGQYERREVSADQRPCFYRFQRPADKRFPVMVELFARVPDALRPLPTGQHLTPIPFDEAVSSLSAILLDDDYYRFIMDGRRQTDGVPHVAEDRLIPLKAVAWLEMRDRRTAGEAIEEQKIRKHLNDVVRLSQLLRPGTTIALADRLKSDMLRFLGEAAMEQTLDPTKLGVRTSLDSVIQRLATIYGLN